MTFLVINFCPRNLSPPPPFSHNPRSTLPSRNWIKNNYQCVTWGWLHDYYIGSGGILDTSPPRHSLSKRGQLTNTWRFINDGIRNEFLNRWFSLLMGASVLYIVGSMTPLCYRTYFGSRFVAIASCGFTSCYDIITWSGYYIIRWLCCYIITWAMSLSTCVGFYFNCNWIKHVLDDKSTVCWRCALNALSWSINLLLSLAFITFSHAIIEMKCSFLFPHHPSTLEVVATQCHQKWKYFYNANATNQFETAFVHEILDNICGACSWMHKKG